MASELKIGVDADAADAKREFRELKDDVSKLADTFGTVAGQVGLAMRNMAADAAIQLAKNFAGDVISATGDLERLRFRTDLVFGPEAQVELAEFSKGLEGLFGMNAERIVGELAGVADKLNLDGTKAEDLEAVKAISQIAGSIALFNDLDAAETLKELVTSLSTGEAGQFEDLLGALELTGDLMTDIEIFAAAAATEMEFATSAASENARAVNETKAAYSELVDELATALLPVLDKIPIAIDIAKGAFDIWLDAAETGIDIAVGAWDGLNTGIELVGETIEDVTGFVKSLIQTIEGIPGSIPNPFGSLPDLPDLGLPDLTPGFSLPNPFTSGSSGRGGGVLAERIEVTVSPFSDAGTIGAGIVTALEDYERGSGASWRDGD